MSLHPCPICPECAAILTRPGDAEFAEWSGRCPSCHLDAAEDAYASGKLTHVEYDPEPVEVRE